MPRVYPRAPLSRLPSTSSHQTDTFHITSTATGSTSTLPSLFLYPPHNETRSRSQALPSTMGTAEDYDQVLKGKYPARAHAKKVAEWVVAKGGDKTGTIYLEAQKAKLLEVGF